MYGILLSLITMEWDPRNIWLTLKSTVAERVQWFQTKGTVLKCQFVRLLSRASQPTGKPTQKIRCTEETAVNINVHLFWKLSLLYDMDTFFIDCDQSICFYFLLELDHKISVSGQSSQVNLLYKMMFVKGLLIHKRHSFLQNNILSQKFWL